MEWLYNGEKITDEQFDNYCAFVYKITNLQDQRSYYGKKRFRFTTHRRTSKRKNRIKSVKESDWRDYYGSSEALKADVEKFGKENFKREILRFCKSLSESSYYELKYQMEHDVLLHPEKYYNAYCGGRISRKQLGIKSS